MVHMSSVSGAHHAGWAYEVCEGHIMPPMEAAMVLQGMPRATRGSSDGFKQQYS